MAWTFPPDLRVRTARPRDALHLLGLHRDVLDEREYFITLPHELTEGLEHKAELIRELDRSPNSVMLVAQRPQVPVAGVLTLMGGTLSRMRHVARLEIMVHPSMRGQGVGSALMTAAIAWAEENPVLTKIALSVFATNTRALAMYERFGFREEGYRRREYRMEDGSWRDDRLLYRFVDGSDADPGSGA